MRRLILLLIAVSLAFAWTVAVGAQQDSTSWSGELGSEATIYPYFADYSWFGLSFNFAAFTISSTTSLSYASPISVSQAFGLAYTLNWFTVGSKLSTGIYPSAFSSLVATIYSKLKLFDVPLGNPSTFSGGIGVQATVYPTVTDDVWLDLSLVLDAFSITSKTTFTLMPVGFSEQRIDLGLAFDGFSIYVWGALSGATFDPSAGAGFFYGFP
jgi:hypothetical protein